MSKPVKVLYLCLFLIACPFLSPSLLFSQPDLTIDRDRLIRDLRTDVLDNNDACYINEGCVGGLGDRQLIRFTTHIRNIGNQDFVVGIPPSDPSQESAVWEWDNCHRHWHYEGYAQYTLFDRNGNIIPVGNKTGFCLMDSECSGGGTLKYHCGFQGISAGCGDIYGWSLDCQWIDVTDVPSGVYRLVNRVNYQNAADLNGNSETNYNNNEASICFRLSRSTTGRHLFELLPDGECAISSCTDRDNDGVCAADDCNDFNANLPATPGTLCNDGNSNTTNDIIQADGCTCQGSIPNCTDRDNDGVCAADDCNDRNANLPAAPGTLCNDGNSNTTNDVIQADGCTCQGTIPSCTDRDNDGVCATDDCDDRNANLPAAPGTPCNDGNSNTTNDVIQANGCTCQGTPTGGNSGGSANCSDIEVAGGAGQITISNLTAARENIQIIGAPTNWRTIQVCDGDCSDPVVINDLEPGEYFVKLNIFGNDNTYCYTQLSTTVTEGGGGPSPCTDLDNDGVCAADDCNDQNANLPATPGTSCNDGNSSTTNDIIQADGCTCQGTIPSCTDLDNDGVCAADDCNDRNANLPAAPGTACNDGNASTINDVIQADGCTCQGTVPGCTDLDNDGVCATDDCDDRNANLPAAPGTACNDGNASTTNDVIQADGCTCQGTPTGGNSGGSANCSDIQVTGGAGQITISNLTAARENIQIIGAPTNWRTVPICDGDCSDPVVINNLDPGSYFIKVNAFGDDNTYCYVQLTTTVTQGTTEPCTDLDNDGVCAADDCNDRNANLPATPGTLCNDGNSNTNNDVIQADGCTCQGTTTTCTDLDNDGVCAADDCNDRNANLPATPGTPCNDGNSNTNNDVIQADGCTCQGETSGGGGTTGDCSDISVNVTGNDISVTGLSAPIEVVKLYQVLGGWVPVDQCIANCGSQYNFENLVPGNYIIEVQFYDASWGVICSEQFNASISSSLVDESATLFRIDTPTEIVTNADKTFSLYPNPAQQSFWLNLNNWESQTLKVTIINHLSQPVLQQEIQHLQGQTQEIQLPSIENGIYFIQITNGVYTATEKLSVAR